MSDESLKKLDEIFSRVKNLERFTDVQLTRAELARKWGVEDETISNYHKLHGMPRLKNGKYAWIAVTDWLYDSEANNTIQGRRILKAIAPKK